MEEGSVGIELKLILLWNICKIPVFGACGDMDLPKLLRFFGGFARKLAGQRVIRFAGFAHQIHRRHAKLHGRSALNEEYVVIIRDAHDPAELGLDGNDYGIVLRRSVTHLHHGAS